jgi:hypothetical protein
MTRSNLDLSFKQRDMLYRISQANGLSVLGVSLQAQPSTILSLADRGLIESFDKYSRKTPTTAAWLLSERGKDVVGCIKKLNAILEQKRKKVT